VGVGVNDAPGADQGPAGVHPLPGEASGKGTGGLSDAELLAVLLRTGVEGRSAVELARRLLEKAGPELPRWEIEDFLAILG